MNIKHSLSLIYMIFVSNIAFASVFDYETTIASVADKLPNIKNRSCAFTQDKYLESSNLHLKSGGNFIFDKSTGLTFNTTYPIKSTVSYNSNEYKQINNVAKAIANKNYSKLEQNFKFFFEENKGIWTFALKPKENSKSIDYIQSIVVSGKEDISEIIITTTDKTKTTIKFFNEKGLNENN